MRSLFAALLVATVALLLAGCAGGAGLQPLSLGQPITIDAGKLPQLTSEARLAGRITLTFERMATADSYNDDICGYGDITAKGKFVVVLYRVRNDAQARMQPSSQLGDEFLLVDGGGRQWQEVGFTSGHCFINANFSEQFGGEGPEHWIDSGFEGLTAVVFDVPKDAQNLSLRHEGLGFSVVLE
jgi:hypothetical protein